VDEATALAELELRLRQAVAEAPTGVLPFEDFMRRALYEPELGYYERTTRQVGREGDFYTSVSVGPLFGELLAFQFSDWMNSLGSAPCLVEVGAHDGKLARDILKWFQVWRPAQFECLTYRVVEPSPIRRQRQAAQLAEFPNHVQWFEAMPPTEGIVFSNELLDAFPVRPVRWEAARRSWLEVGVTWDEGRFRETNFARRASTPVPELPDVLLAVLPEGFTTEFSPAAESWWENTAQSLRQGHLVAVDYGLTDAEFFLPQRVNGTRRGYRQHRFVDDLLARPGDCDLTAHVNFTRIAAAGERHGLVTRELVAQQTWLTGVLQQTLAQPERFEAWDARRSRQFQTLTHPEHLGRGFRRLVQSRVVPR